MRKFAFEIIAIAIANSAVAGTRDEGIATKCAREWPTDYRMQLYCQKTQEEALRNLDELARRWGRGSEGQEIIARCMEQWTNADDIVDWRMALYCTKQQAAALEELQR